MLLLLPELLRERTVGEDFLVGELVRTAGELDLLLALPERTVDDPDEFL